MKINNYTNMMTSLNKRSETKKNATSDFKKTATEAVQVNISKEAQALLNADKTEFSERVNAIKHAIQNGEYEVDPSKISDGILHSINAQKGH